MNYDYFVKDGIYHLGFDLSKLEKKIINMCCEHLELKGFNYLSIPSCVSKQTISDQDVVFPDNVFNLFVKNSSEKHQYLSGSAEQGILEYLFQYLEHGNIESQYIINDKVHLIYAVNQCFRNESFYDRLFKVKEFIKVEQYCLCDFSNWEEKFEFLLKNATEFLDKFPFIKYRVIDRTKHDPGYHVLKYDIEINTKEYGWLETHSCTYFGNEQLKRFSKKDLNIHSISNTGIASPRILIPFIENNIIL